VPTRLAPILTLWLLLLLLATATAIDIDIDNDVAGGGVLPLIDTVVCYLYCECPLFDSNTCSVSLPILTVTLLLFSPHLDLSSSIFPLFFR